MVISKISIWAIVETLTGFTNQVHCGPGSNVYGGLLYSTKISRTTASPSNTVLCYNQNILILSRFRPELAPVGLLLVIGLRGLSFSVYLLNRAKIIASIDPKKGSWDYQALFLWCSYMSFDSYVIFCTVKWFHVKSDLKGCRINRNTRYHFTLSLDLPLDRGYSQCALSPADRGG